MNRKSLSDPLKKALHLVKENGALTFDAARKLKQIEHFCQILIPKIEAQNATAKGKPIELIELGSGKSYLGLALYDLWVKDHPNVTLHCVDQREDLMETGRKICKELKFVNTNFYTSRIKELDHFEQTTDSSKIVVALHACDTATDEALEFALKLNAKLIALVPCCQAQVSRVIKPKHATMRTLIAHPLHKREFSALITNRLRSLKLESKDYQVTVTEFTDKDHTPKAELIVAEQTHAAEKSEFSAQKSAELNQLLGELGLSYDSKEFFYKSANS